MHPLVFLPGAGGRASFWHPVAERLAPLGAAQAFVRYPGFDGEPPEASIGSLDDLLAWLLPRLPAGPWHLVAQSMGGVLAVRLALEEPARVASLSLCATSGGVDVAGLGGVDWRPDYRRELPEVPDWFEVDRTDVTARLGAIRVPTLILYSDADPICPPAVPALLAARIPGARTACVPGGTHMFGEERPDEVAGKIGEFLRHITRVETKRARGCE